MKKLVMSTVVGASLMLLSAVGYTAAPANAPAGTTGLCKDGSYYSGPTRKGACKGHKGVKDWYAEPAAAATPAPAARTAAPAAAAATAPAGSTGLCNDGTYYSGPTKKGACKGHKGVKDWYGASASAAPTPAARTAAPAPAPAAAAATAPAGSTGLCNDGTYYSGPTKKGACKGHKGVKDWYGAPAAAAATAPATAAPATPAKASPPTSPAPKVAADAGGAAPGGAAGRVWINKSTKVYHCPGDKWYGKTKEGEYMSEAEATAQGFRPDHGKVCK